MRVVVELGNGITSFHDLAFMIKGEGLPPALRVVHTKKP